ncbi:hypothetical protein L596_007576 [Steinernema carpocapsae]|uniref:MADF domain-containing protein n=1 Tax=Steinernema carpocapsae TaxID=34508 RepID=A0A4U5PAR6_STECR|nr:hypothetical protein L596_007576 [Steinernema carpocapsae]
MATRKSARIADTQQRHAAEVAKQRDSTVSLRDEGSALRGTSTASSSTQHRTAAAHHHTAPHHQSSQQYHRTPVSASSGQQHNAHLGSRSAPVMSAAAALPGTQARNPSLQDVYGDQSIIDLIDLIKENSVLWTYEIGLGSRSASRPLCMAWNIVYEAMVQKYPQVTRNMLKQAWKSLKRRHRQTGGTFTFSRRMAFLDGAELDLNSPPRSSYGALTTTSRPSLPQIPMRRPSRGSPPPQINVNHSHIHHNSHAEMGYLSAKTDPNDALNSMYPTPVLHHGHDDPSINDENDDEEGENVMVGGDDTPQGAASRVTSTVNVHEEHGNIDVGFQLNQLNATLTQLRQANRMTMNQSNANEVAALNEVLQNNRSKAFPLGELIKDRLEQLEDKNKLWEAERRILAKVEEIVADVVRQQEGDEAPAQERENGVDA